MCVVFIRSHSQFFDILCVANVAEKFKSVDSKMENTGTLFEAVWHIVIVPWRNGQHDDARGLVSSLRIFSI